MEEIDDLLNVVQSVLDWSSEILTPRIIVASLGQHIEM